MKKSNNEFSILEQSIAQFFSRAPFIKQFLKRVYRLFLIIFYFISIKKRKSYNKTLNKIYAEGETFFGYYDHSPLSECGGFCVFHQSLHDTSKKQLNKPINIMVKNMKTMHVCKVSEVYAFNWQQGARLQWINNNEIIFNNLDINNQNEFAQIVDVKTQKRRFINFLIYESRNDFSLTLNFNRLNKFAPDYGYLNLSKNCKKLVDDGIFYIDHHKNTSTLLWSLDTLSLIINKDYLTNKNQHVNHIMLSPDDQNCIFLHRVRTKNETVHTLFCGNLDSKKINVLATGLISHCYWLNKETVIGYLEHEGSRGYFSININTSAIQKLNHSEIHQFGDGHPSIYNNKMVFDTYPNRQQFKSLFLLDMQSNELSKVLELYEPFRFFGYSRCDLHPRWSKDGEHIFIDSTHTGKRQLYMLES